MSSGQQTQRESWHKRNTLNSDKGDTLLDIIGQKAKKISFLL